MIPRLTIVIPTYNRPALLPRAVEGALNQTVPCRVLVSDDGDCDRTDAILRERFGEAFRSGRIAHLRTGAPDAWSNWRAGAESADTELVAWAQDDDVVCRTYAERIAHAFGEAGRRGARPHVWMARLHCADDTGRFGWWHLGNGPWLPMRSLHGVCEPGHWGSCGGAVAASMYLTSWSLSPALAYRNGPEFKAALAAMPATCDIFVERIIPAEMARHGGVIADPAVVGYWVRHDDHLSDRQHADQPRQTRLLIAHLDGLLDRIGADAWRAQFAAWCAAIPSVHMLGWLNQLDTTEAEGGTSRHSAELRRIMVESLRGRLRAVAGVTPRPPWWRRAMRRIGVGK